MLVFLKNKNKSMEMDFKKCVVRQMETCTRCICYTIALPPETQLKGNPIFFHLSGRRRFTVLTGQDLASLTNLLPWSRYDVKEKGLVRVIKQSLRSVSKKIRRLFKPFRSASPLGSKTNNPIGS